MHSNQCIDVSKVMKPFYLDSTLTFCFEFYESSQKIEKKYCCRKIVIRPYTGKMVLKLSKIFKNINRKTDILTDRFTNGKLEYR